MTSMEEIKQKEKELAKQKWCLEMQRQFDWHTEHNPNNIIPKFLGSENGVHWDQIAWLIEYKKDQYPQEVENLKCVAELYRTPRLKRMYYDSAQRYVDRLKPLGFKIKIKTDYSNVQCITCDYSEKTYRVVLLKDEERGYGGKNSYLVRGIKTKKLFHFNLLVDWDKMNSYLDSIVITTDNLEAIIDILKTFKEIHHNQGIASHKWICSDCIQNPDYKKITDVLKLEHIQPEWLSIVKRNPEEL